VADFFLGVAEAPAVAATMATSRRRPTEEQTPSGRSMDSVPQKNTDTGAAQPPLPTPGPQPALPAAAGRAGAGVQIVWAAAPSF